MQLSLQNHPMGIESYFATTPLSQELSHTLASHQQAHCQELQDQMSPPLMQNPFQQAAEVRAPITANPPPSPLVSHFLSRMVQGLHLDLLGEPFISMGQQW